MDERTFPLDDCTETGPMPDWHAVFAALPTPAGVYHADCGALVEANAGLQALFPDAEAVEKLPALLASARLGASTLGHVHVEVTPLGRYVLVTCGEPDAPSRLFAAVLEADIRYRALADQSLFGVLILDGETVADLNPVCAEMLGCTPEELTGRGRLADLVALQSLPVVRARLARWREGADLEHTLRFQAVRKDGRFADMKMQGRPVEAGGRRMLACTLTDVTEAMRAERQLEHLAFHDALTDLPNRALYCDRLTQAIQRAKRYGEEFAVMLIDLDGFKAINDRFGHEAGDMVLRKTAQRFGTCLRDSDTLSRHGGDEFTVLLQGVAEAAEIEAAAARIVAAASEPIAVGADECRIGASVGIARYPVDGTTIESLLGSADAAMYAAKDAGKGRYAFFDRRFMLTPKHESLLVDWSAAFEVGVRVIDEEHRRLVELANGLAAAIAAAEEEPRIAAMVGELVALTASHFRTEETLMDLHALPDTEIHRQDHRRLLLAISEIQPHIAADGPSRTLVAIKDWLLAHVRHADRKLAWQLNARGVF